MAAPTSSDPPAGSPVPAPAPNTSTPMRTSAASARDNAAATGARRPIRADRISSARPVSSSDRVCRPTRNMFIGATTIAR